MNESDYTLKDGCLNLHLDAGLVCIGAEKEELNISGLESPRNNKTTLAPKINRRLHGAGSLRKGSKEASGLGSHPAMLKKKRTTSSRMKQSDRGR